VSEDRHDARHTVQISQMTTPNCRAQLTCTDEQQIRDKASGDDTDDELLTPVITRRG
jgi:hypothetical protein